LEHLDIRQRPDIFCEDFIFHDERPFKDVRCFGGVEPSNYYIIGLLIEPQKKLKI
jgi:hypothetical protein